MTTVFVDTAEIQTTGNPSDIKVATQGNNVVTIDTIRRDMDGIVAETDHPVPSTKKVPPTVTTTTMRPIPERRIKTPSPPSPLKQTKVFDGESAFREALKTTLPAPVASTTVDTDDDEEEQMPQEEEEQQMPEETTEVPEGFGGEEEEQEEEEEEEKSTPPPSNTPSPAKDEDGDEDIRKLKLIDLINAKTAEGFLPPQAPSFSMSENVLKKILDHQNRMEDTEFGIDIIGFGFISIMKLFQIGNEVLDPVGRIYPGHSLLLDGLSEKIEKNIRKYRGPFRRMYESFRCDKLTKMGPWISMALITSTIIKETHIENVRKRMIDEAENELRRPGDRAEAEKFLHEAIPTAAAAAAPDVVGEQQPSMMNPEDITIPTSDSEEQAPQSRMEDDEEEIVVQKSKKSSGGKRRKQK